jgi:hypothetical protein
MVLLYYRFKFLIFDEFCLQAPACHIGQLKWQAGLCSLKSYGKAIRQKVLSVLAQVPDDILNHFKMFLSLFVRFIG